VAFDTIGVDHRVTEFEHALGTRDGQPVRDAADSAGAAVHVKDPSPDRPPPNELSARAPRWESFAADTAIRVASRSISANGSPREPRGASCTSSSVHARIPGTATPDSGDSMISAQPRTQAVDDLRRDTASTAVGGYKVGVSLW
jgi:hypothetical protein